ncbi:MAG: hypothetical protein QM589_17410 [Thermomicrobiales bacterium]
MMEIRRVVGDMELGDTEQLTSAVYGELVALRGAHGKLTVEKFSQYPSLQRVCSAGGVLNAFLRFERELERYVRHGGRNEVAAALSISAPWETVLERLEAVITHVYPDGDGPDQRTARRWSDQGMHTIATELVHLADVQQRLGSELITIELSGTYEGEITMAIYQLTTRHPEERAPLVRLWNYPQDDREEQDTTVTYDLDQVESLEGTKGPYRLRCYSFNLEIPKLLALASVKAGVLVYRITIEGRDAPLRAVSFQDESDLRVPNTTG